jgi:hypothetical protein
MASPEGAALVATVELSPVRVLIFHTNKDLFSEEIRVFPSLVRAKCERSKSALPVPNVYVETMVFDETDILKIRRLLLLSMRYKKLPSELAIILPEIVPAGSVIDVTFFTPDEL